jgi:hypothetical protein
MNDRSFISYYYWYFFVLMPFWLDYKSFISYYFWHFFVLMPFWLVCMETYGIAFLTPLFVLFISKHHHHYHRDSAMAKLREASRLYIMQSTGTVSICCYHVNMYLSLLCIYVFVIIIYICICYLSLSCIYAFVIIIQVSMASFEVSYKYIHIGMYMRSNPLP